ncbi:MAG: hypothetical protein ACRCX2_22110 [Paraclostridium sp.]
MMRLGNYQNIKDYLEQGYILEVELDGKILEYTGEAKTQGDILILSNDGLSLECYAPTRLLCSRVYVMNPKTQKPLQMTDCRLVEIDRIRLLSEEQSVDFSNFLAQLGAER